MEVQSLRRSQVTVGASVSAFAMRIARYALMTAPPSVPLQAATAAQDIRACLTIAVPCVSRSDLLGLYSCAWPQAPPDHGE